MITVPSENYSPMWDDDPRPALPTVGDERQTLTTYLDWHRATLEMKCAGLTSAQLRERAVKPSRLTLHGIVRHLADVERWWFRIQLAGEDVPLLFYADDDPDADFEGLSGDPEADLAAWREECEASRRVVAALPSLETTGVVLRTGQPISARAVLVKMVAEYAQHNGHADLLRECLDGRTGL